MHRIKQAVRHPIIGACLLVVLLVVAQSLCAKTHDVSNEQAQLARIVQVLNSITPLIDSAEQAQPKNTQTPVCFDCLRHDIRTMQSSINAQIRRENRVAREEPLAAFTGYDL